jgi:signal transduction histidine kinase
VTGVRLLLCSVLLGLLGSLHLRDGSRAPTFTVQTALGTLAVAFALTAAYAAALRSHRNLQRQVSMQLSVDPALWTVIVYLSGGPASGATSLYGLSCVTGALLTGFRGSMTALGASVGCFGALVLGSTTGLLSPPPDQPVDVYQMSDAELVYTTVVNVLAMIVVALLAGSLAERLRVTGGQLVEARERAAQAERMAALGRVAAGLAHEIRNPLGAISGSIQLLRSSPALAEEDQRLCNIISREASRLSDLVSDMMNLAKPRRPTLASTNAADIARDVVALASEWGRSASDVVVRYRGPEQALVVADGAQLKQLTWNLVRNAVQASHAGGVVDVTLDVDHAGSPRARLGVSDEGVGLDEEARARIFDAFFTTRAQGTGVGLAVVKRIADDHGFAIDVQSESGQGARFVVDLGPLVQLPAGTRVQREEKRTLVPTGP